jgi:hypothetical protein
MVNSNSLATIKDFPLTKEIRRILPSITEVFAINNILFVYNTKTEEPVECAYIAEEPNRTFLELRDALVESHKFSEAKIDKFIECFADLWLKLVIEEDRIDSDYGKRSCFIKAMSLKSLDQDEMSQPSPRKQSGRRCNK